jgi:glycine dehydrogenase
MNTESFELRHIGIRPKDYKIMLNTIGVESVEQLLDETIPENIRLSKPLNLEAPMSEHDYLEHIHALSMKNKVFKSYIGLGYHPTNLPAVIQRNILENPGWYTAYTPYQAEIAQGRLEALLNFQTLICDLTGMEIANASLLDEGTAAAEAMTFCFGKR